MPSTFLETLISASTSKADLRAKVGDAINALQTFAAKLDALITSAPAAYAESDPDFAAFVESLPLPKVE
jgi:hypothetical protein